MLCLRKRNPQRSNRKPRNQRRPNRRPKRNDPFGIYTQDEQVGLSPLPILGYRMNRHSYLAESDLDERGEASGRKAQQVVNDLAAQDSNYLARIF
jgi:hypothetical protein